MQDRATELAEKIWVTKGARFNAYRRLNGKHESSLTATALMSVYVVFLQLVPAFLPAQTVFVEPNAVTLLTAFMAIAILVLSLIEHGKAYQLRAERLHQCGIRLNELYDEFENRRPRETEAATSLLDEISKRYHGILRSVPENHEPIDNEVFRAQHREHFKVAKLRVAVIRLKQILMTYGLAWVLIIGFPVAALLWIL